MSIGTTLSRAREAAGLSIAEVSSRTRIRTSLIRAIEADDFGPCGGDFYARGHIRAIARVVGADSRPLIEDYDELGPGQRAAEPAGIEDLFLPAEAPGPVTAPQPAADGAPEGLPEGGTGGQAVPPPGVRKGRRNAPLGKLAGTAVLAVLALAVIGTGAYRLASDSSGTTAAAPAKTASPKAPVRQSAAAPASPSAKPSTPGPSPSKSPKKITLTRVTPSGASADDNAGDASKALAGDSGDPWKTHWYTSASFGNLKPGTGLTLTLPRTVTVTGVTVKFADSGGSMQVKAGTSPGSLHTVASGSAGGTQTLSFSATSARYIELWFTKLATTSGGSYQMAVYDVSVSARKSS